MPAHDRAGAVNPREHFHRLNRADQAAAIRRMAAEGYSDHTIAHATELAVEFVRAVLGDREAPRREANG
jgi:hypothetical protein